MNISNRHFIRAKDVKKLVEDLLLSLPNLDPCLFEGRRVEVATVDSKSLLLVDGAPEFIKTESLVFPSLLNDSVLEHMPKIVVDEGAVPHICNGSDLMAPGIVRISGAFSKGALVAIVEQKFNKKIAIMRVLLDSSAMEATRRGKVAENIHYVGDRLWRVYKNFA